MQLARFARWAPVGEHGAEPTYTRGSNAPSSSLTFPNAVSRDRGRRSEYATPRATAFDCRATLFSCFFKRLIRLYQKIYYDLFLYEHLFKKKRK